MGAESPTVGLVTYWPTTHPTPPKRSIERGHPLSPNRKPHRKRIMFLHKPVKERAAKRTETHS